MGTSRDIGTDSEYLPTGPWYRRMLGPSSLSWQTVVFAGILNFPQMVLTGGNLGARTVAPGEYPTIAAVSAATVLVSFVYGYAAHKSTFRNRKTRPVSLATFLIFYAVGGLLYSVGIQVSDAVSGSPSSIPFALRAINAMTLSIAWGIGVALILDGRSRFRRERDALVEELVAEQERLASQSRTVHDTQVGLAAPLGESLSQHLEEIRQAAELARSPGSEAQDIRRLAATIDTAADVGARESSHQMWQEALSVATTPKLGQTLRLALTSPRVIPGVMAALVVLGVPTVGVRNFGLWWGLPATVALGVVVWLWMRTLQRFVLSRWSNFLLAFIGTVAAVTAFSLLPAPVTSQTPGEFGAIVIGVAGGFILVSFIAALESEREGALKVLRRDVVVEEATRLAQARAVAALARRLHGPVQTTLRVCAAEIERAADANDAPAIDAAVQVAMQTLSDATLDPASTDTSFEESLAHLAAAWEGFMDVSINVDPDIELSDRGPDVVEVVGEALSNAHHHGGATSARVRVSPDPEGLRIRVEDNGSASSVGTPGLGTRLLRTLTIDHHLEISPHGATLDAVIPLAAEPPNTNRSKP